MSEDVFDEFDEVLAEPFNDAGLFVDVAALLAGDVPEPPERSALFRTDGEALFYRGQVNFLFGDPESGKTFVAIAGAVGCLRDRGRAVLIDLDHNGPAATISRLVDMGAPLAALKDPDRFRYVEPEDRGHLLACVASCKGWQPDYAVVDSVGELLPIMGLSSNSPDDFTEANLRVLKPLAMAGAAVVAIDHLAKNTDSRQMGPTGTTAKRRAIGGVSLRVKVDEPFTPGIGGRAVLTVNKDRHGGVRAVSEAPDGAGEVFAGTFALDSSAATMTWAVHAPGNRAGGHRVEADVAELMGLDPEPTSQADVKRRMGWGSNRAMAALKVFRERSSGVRSGMTVPLPVDATTPTTPPPPSSGVDMEEGFDKGKYRTTPEGRGASGEHSSKSTHRGRSGGVLCRIHGSELQSAGCWTCEQISGGAA